LKKNDDRNGEGRKKIRRPAKKIKKKECPYAAPNPRKEAGQENFTILTARDQLKKYSLNAMHLSSSRLLFFKCNAIKG